MENKIYKKIGKWELIDIDGVKTWKKDGYHRKAESWMLHPSFIDIADVLSEFVSERILFIYFIVGFIISFLYIVCMIFFYKAKITFLMGLISGIWWLILGIPTFVFVLGALTIALPVVIFQNIIKTFLMKTVAIKCPYCNGDGCGHCYRRGKIDIRVWKADANKYKF